MNILSNSGVVTRKHTSVQGGSLLKWLTYALHTSRSIPLGDAWELLQMFCFVSFFSRFFSFPFTVKPESLLVAIQSSRQLINLRDQMFLCPVGIRNSPKRETMFSPW